MSVKNFNAVIQFRIGLLLVFVTASVQSIILFNNVMFTFNSFGVAFVVIYLGAASCYIAMPWLVEIIDEIAHSGATRMTLLVFCFWVTLEEHVHAAHQFKSPEAITSFWAIFFEHDTAKKIAIFLVVAALLGVVEVLFHFQHHGVNLIKNSQEDMKS